MHLDTKKDKTSIDRKHHVQRDKQGMRPKARAPLKPIFDTISPWKRQQG